MIIDRKFKILAVNPCNGKIYTDNEGVFFCAKDIAFLEGALPAYREKCKEIGCDSNHLESIDLLINRVKLFQDKIESKIPDTNEECEIERCIGGKYE